MLVVSNYMKKLVSKYIMFGRHAEILLDFDDTSRSLSDTRKLLKAQIRAIN